MRKAVRKTLAEKPLPQRQEATRVFKGTPHGELVKGKKGATTPYVFQSGNYHDNDVALSVAASYLENSLVQESETILRRLEHDILQSGEIKSVVWLLPVIRKLLSRNRPKT